MKPTRGTRELLMALDFLAGARRAWGFAHELGLPNAAGLINIARGRSWAAKACFREWRWELQVGGVL